MKLDQFFDRFRSPGYNCWDHSCEVWQAITGQQLKRDDGSIDIKALHKLRRIDAPVSPCIVWMKHSLIPRHVGVFVGDRVLHLAARGVEYMPLELVIRNFRSVRYYQ